MQNMKYLDTSQNSFDCLWLCVVQYFSISWRMDRAYSMPTNLLSSRAESCTVVKRPADLSLFLFFSPPTFNCSCTHRDTGYILNFFFSSYQFSSHYFDKVGSINWTMAIQCDIILNFETLINDLTRFHR